jgi:hypothetical protein
MIRSGRRFGDFAAQGKIKKLNNGQTFILDDYRLHSSPVADFPSAIIWHFRKLHISHFYSCNVRLSFIDAHASWGT